MTWLSINHSWKWNDINPHTPVSILSTSIVFRRDERALLVWFKHLKFSTLKAIVWMLFCLAQYVYEKSSARVVSGPLSLPYMPQNSCSDPWNTSYHNFFSYTDATFYLGPWSDSVFLFVLVHSGDKWFDGSRGLARGHTDPSGYSARWLRQRPGRLRPPLLTVSRSINESFKCMEQQCKRGAKKNLPQPKKRTIYLLSV